VYSTFLDEHMHITPAVFSPGQRSLAEAHHAFTERVFQAAGLANAESILEIGGGWGALAMQALKDHNCKCVATPWPPEA
jgi:cyclopropane-fatty-acyl-phospholipid synthase